MQEEQRGGIVKYGCAFKSCISVQTLANVVCATFMTNCAVGAHLFLENIPVKVERWHPWTIHEGEGPHIAARWSVTQRIRNVGGEQTWES